MDKNSAETSKREDERMSPDVPPATGRERREPADSLELLSDSREPIEDSIKRTGLQSLLDEAFQAAIEKNKTGDSKSGPAASLTFEEALPGSLGSKEMRYGSSRNYNRFYQGWRLLP
jgi:hypothetical protein